MQAVIFVPDASAWTRAGAAGGLSPLERQLRQLRALRCVRATLLVATRDGVPPLAASAPELCVHAVEPGTDPFAALAAAARVLPECFVFLAADYVLDARVLRAVADAAGETLLRDADGKVAPIGRLSQGAVERHGAALAAHVQPLPIASLDPYSAELRGVLAPYLVRVRSDADRRIVWRVLLDGAQKRGLDLPGEYFDSPFENALVRVLAPTRVTANQVTLATLAVAVLVGVLFLRGRLALGLALALVVGILDGVDGKLARLKLATSRLGELEHIGDYLYENFWWVALALHLHAASGLVALRWAGVTLVACDLADNLLYGAVRLRTGRLLDELSSFDRGVRRVAGRRNVYVWMLIAGVSLGFAADAYIAVAAWALCTVAVHAGRAAYWTVRAGAIPVAPLTSR